jgi:hypothetical protein
MPLEAFAVGVSGHMFHANHAAHAASALPPAASSDIASGDGAGHSHLMVSNSVAGEANHDCNSCALCHAKTAKVPPTIQVPDVVFVGSVSIPFVADEHKSADPRAPEHVPLPRC